MAKQTWESMIYTAEGETRFVGDHLGPALKAAGPQDKKLIVWDHNRAIF
jgi:glucosylceramidase